MRVARQGAGLARGPVPTQPLTLPGGTSRVKLARGVWHAEARTPAGLAAPLANYHVGALLDGPHLRVGTRRGGRHHGKGLPHPRHPGPQRLHVVLIERIAGDAARVDVLACLAGPIPVGRAAVPGAPDVREDPLITLNQCVRVVEED